MTTNTTTSINLIKAICDGIITPEQALALQGMGVDSAAEQARKPRKKSVKKVQDPQPKAEVPAEPKAEEPAEEPEGFSYTKGGAVIQYALNHTLKANHLRRVENAIGRLVEAGFCMSWKRIGGWVYLYHNRKADGKTNAEFEAALELLPKGWELFKSRRGVEIVDKNMCADYADNFR